MGLFRDFKNHLTWDKIKDNGLPRGSGIEICEKCRYRVYDKGSDYLVCAVHRFHVGAGQVCGKYEYGEPVYVMN